VDQHVEAWHGEGETLAEPLDCVQVAQVDLLEAHAGAGLAKEVGGVTGFGLAGVVGDHDVAPRAGEGQRGGEADALGAAGDERDGPLARIAGGRGVRFGVRLSLRRRALGGIVRRRRIGNGREFPRVAEAGVQGEGFVGVDPATGLAPGVETSGWGRRLLAARLGSTEGHEEQEAGDDQHADEAQRDQERQTLAGEQGLGGIRVGSQGEGQDGEKLTGHAGSA
jgi:hypothetical protein